MADKYLSLAALEEHAGRHTFRVKSLDRSSKATIVSPHGGFIEPGTSALSRAVAGHNFNLFDFQGVRRINASELHVTATRFRHQVLESLLAQSNVAISIHGMGETNEETVWVGGLNTSLKNMVCVSLQQNGFSVNPDSPKYRGESPRNLVNLTRDRGVQLELPLRLLNTMFVGEQFRLAGSLTTTPRFLRFVRAVRRPVLQYISRPSRVA